jgi:hypothetical protein
MDVWFVKPSADCCCGNRVFKIDTEFCCHLCCCTVILESLLQCVAITFT